MAPLTSKEQDDLAEKLRRALLETPFACYSLIPLDGGTTSFVFRGELVVPFSLGHSTFTSTVIVKHATDFASCNQDFKLDDSRAEFEVKMLQELRDFWPLHPTSRYSVKAPRSLFYDEDARFQVMEDITDSTELTKLIPSPETCSEQAPYDLRSTGSALGSWLREFHEWTAAPAQASLRKIISRNQEMRKLKRRITYDTVVKILEEFPNVLRPYREGLSQIQDMMTREFELKLSECNENGDEWGIIHGDFWTGNVLFAKSQMNAISTPVDAHLYVIDWEFAQIGHRSIDLGQIVGDLLESNHFDPSSNVFDLIEGLIGGYGVVSTNMGFRIAIHVGVHMINWYSRHPAPHGYPSNQVESLMEDATEFMIRGWNRDRIWFEGTVLKSLFSKGA